MTFNFPETENYTLTTGYSENYKQDLYQLINKHTGIIEVETSVFAQAYEALQQLDDSFIDVSKEFKKASLSLVQ